MLVRIRDAEACLPTETFFWDSVWINTADASGGFADWRRAGPDDPAAQRGGLRARDQLMTAIIIQLFTDRRLPEGMRAPGDNGDPRGWWGNSIKLDGEPEAEIGSLLWTLERGTLDDDTAKLAKTYVEDALQMIADQGAVGSFKVETSVNRAGFLAILISAFENSGRPLGQPFLFDVVWGQQRRPAESNYFANPR